MNSENIHIYINMKNHTYKYRKNTHKQKLWKKPELQFKIALFFVTCISRKKEKEQIENEDKNSREL